MDNGIERNLGKQPIADIMLEFDLSANDLVSATTEQVTYKMISRAVKGRRLTKHIQRKILKAMNERTEKEYSIKDLFNY